MLNYYNKLIDDLSLYGFFYGSKFFWSIRKKKGGVSMKKKCPKCNNIMVRDLDSGMVATSEDDQHVRETEIWYCDDCQYTEI